jgi:septal ring factor EnvC (AmiA/AmiB activator)
MARTKTTKTIDAKIAETEEKLRKLKERCDKVATELDELYAEKQEHENEELLAAIQNSCRSRAEIIAFLESK